MSRRPESTEIRDDGLRFVQRQAGSPFNAGGNSHRLKSCFFCGKHKVSSDGQHLKLAGRHQFVCFGCRPPKEAPEAGAGETATEP